MKIIMILLAASMSSCATLELNLRIGRQDRDKPASSVAQTVILNTDKTK